MNTREDILALIQDKTDLIPNGEALAVSLSGWRWTFIRLKLGLLSRLSALSPLSLFDRVLFSCAPERRNPRADESELRSVELRAYAAQILKLRASCDELATENQRLRVEARERELALQNLDIRSDCLEQANYVLADRLKRATNELHLAQAKLAFPGRLR